MDNEEVLATVAFIRFEGLWYLSVTVAGGERELGVYPTAKAAAEKANRWLSGRGLKWAKDSARRLDDAQRTDAPCVIFDVVRG